eukprot:scaffold202456_cov28-Tisochrysis_lutea.AAC.7
MRQIWTRAPPLAEGPPLPPGWQLCQGRPSSDKEVARERCNSASARVAHRRCAPTAQPRLHKRQRTAEEARRGGPPPRSSRAARSLRRRASAPHHPHVG